MITNVYFNIIIMALKKHSWVLYPRSKVTVSVWPSSSRGSKRDVCPLAPFRQMW